MNDIIDAAGDSMKEVAPGFFETRRRMLWLPLLAAPVLFARTAKAIANQMGNSGSRAASPPTPQGRLDWESFIKQCMPVASELHKDLSAPGQEAYLHWLASMIARARTEEIPKAKLGRFGKLDPPVSFGVSYRSALFFVVEWKLEAGACLPPHCHPNASACTVGLEGEARIRNFEVVGQAPEFSSRQSFLVRETHNELITQGRINTLSAMRDNIHTFQAGPNVARGIDISTYHGADVGFSFLDIGGKPREPDGRIFEAVWKGQSV
jgi:hypothetical protein